MTPTDCTTACNPTATTTTQPERSQTGSGHYSQPDQDQTRQTTQPSTNTTTATVTTTKASQPTNAYQPLHPPADGQLPPTYWHQSDSTLHSTQPHQRRTTRALPHQTAVHSQV